MRLDFNNQFAVVAGSEDVKIVSEGGYFLNDDFVRFADSLSVYGD